MNAGDGEGDQPGPGRRDADRLRRHLAAAQRPQASGRPCPRGAGHRERRRRRARRRRARGTTCRRRSPTGRSPAAAPSVPWSSDVSPPPTHENFTMTASKKKAKASVAMATQMPPSRRIGQRQQRADDRGDQRADRARRRAPTCRSGRRAGTPRSAPMAANVPWHSEIWPARPVITVIDRKMVARTTAWVTRNSHDCVGPGEHDDADDDEERRCRRAG